MALRFKERRTAEKVLEIALAAKCPFNEETRAAMRGYAWGVWTLSGRTEFAEVASQNPDGTLGFVADLYPDWMAWAHGGRPDAILELSKHAYFMTVLQEGGAFAAPPILMSHKPCGWNKQVIDGRHRLYAAYEFMQQNPHLEVDILWNAQE